MTFHCMPLSRRGVIELCEVRRNEAYIALPDGHTLGYKGVAESKERGAGLLIKKNLAWNVEEFFSINE